MAQIPQFVSVCVCVGVSVNRNVKSTPKNAVKLRTYLCMCVIYALDSQHFSSVVTTSIIIVL